MEAIAAIHGVYNRLNTRSEAAATCVNASFTAPPNKISRVEITLSFAITPLINEVQILQSPSPSGAKIGTRQFEIIARILSLESATRLKCKSNFCKNQIQIVVFVQRDDVRASVRALNDATAIVEGGRSFVIFPEGTRYKGEEGGAGEFKAGAFRIAVKTGAPVVPVAVTGARALFETNGNRCRPGGVRIKIMSPIQTAGMSKAEQKQLPDAVRQSILAALK